METILHNVTKCVQKSLAPPNPHHSGEKLTRAGVEAAASLRVTALQLGCLNTVQQN